MTGTSKKPITGYNPELWNAGQLRIIPGNPRSGMSQYSLDISRSVSELEPRKLKHPEICVIGAGLGSMLTLLLIPGSVAFDFMPDIIFPNWSIALLVFTVVLGGSYGMSVWGLKRFDKWLMERGI